MRQHWAPKRLTTCDTRPWHYPQAGKSTSGDKREAQTRIVNEFFRRENGRLVAQPDAPFFQEILRRRTDKRLEQWQEGTLVSLDMCV